MATEYANTKIEKPVKKRLKKFAEDQDLAVSKAITKLLDNWERTNK